MHLIDDLSDRLFDITVKFPIDHAPIVKAILHFIFNFSTDPHKFAQLFLNQLINDVSLEDKIIARRHQPTSPSQMALPLEGDSGDEMQDDELMETTQINTTDTNVRAAVVEELSEYFNNMLPSYQRDNIDFIYNLAEVSGNTSDSIVKKQEMIFRGIISSLTTEVRKQRKKCEHKKTRRFSHLSDSMIVEWDYVSRLVYQVILDKQIIKMKYTMGKFPLLLKAYNEYIQEMKRVHRLLLSNRSELSHYPQINLDSIMSTIHDIVNFVKPSERASNIPKKQFELETQPVIPIEVQDVVENEPIQRKRKREDNKKKRKKKKMTSYVSANVPPESEWSSTSEDVTDEELVALLEKAAKKKKKRIFNAKTPRQLAQSTKISNFAKAKRKRGRKKLDDSSKPQTELMEDPSNAQHFSFRQAAEEQHSINELSFIT
eukprot:CAMPEP_0117422262 /NCGR_PEP_ID=MMETSP0758-20121206/3139_1 /TAXON_ID=63605 /ORGANISM="Percolomonas cosmopolitus, Strain AE-1 (ATCC 50343)" /LENGTH=429 /DNA_ID=CAMNT_0005204781 /DNA_START=2340 /DNA_END=3629 /DNA_ORIENTATION=-